MYMQRFLSLIIGVIRIWFVFDDINFEHNELAQEIIAFKSQLEDILYLSLKTVDKSSIYTNGEETQMLRNNLIDYYSICCEILRFFRYIETINTVLLDVINELGLLTDRLERCIYI